MTCIFVFLIVFLLERSSSGLTSSQHELVAFQYPVQSDSSGETADADLLGQLQDFQSAADVNEVPGKLFMAHPRNRIATRRAAVLAYIGNMLLRSVSAVDSENQPTNAAPQIIMDVPRPVTSNPSTGHHHNQDYPPYA
jgi:hypothetical protein